MNNIGKGLTGLGISLAVAMAVYVTKDTGCLWFLLFAVLTAIAN